MALLLNFQMRSIDAWHGEQGLSFERQVLKRPSAGVKADVGFLGASHYLPERIQFHTTDYMYHMPIYIASCEPPSFEYSWKHTFLSFPSEPILRRSVINYYAFLCVAYIGSLRFAFVIYCRKIFLLYVSAHLFNGRIGDRGDETLSKVAPRWIRNRLGD